ncbi:tyrosine-protein kinase CSK-like [Anneissia japonica]|uniref:tyrosine-protein kinase CSK-like n=1 Tax=Anneissia japonica TaxID=1529436 RepID=UPI00142571C0|nr:tyrosine-protein kinase CSK-like [Anneissia japonica]XP_033120718.1 tyrosine-protein kinase CSK-like [Anneissia japonica]XP_033120719.1 tyrosine-protein kinase CSK-like [Anneissia japonica]XP_033120720.1 tyrosine-protein kinase CSK-like [Anneissia japonica]XP_033120721.1 tyrosine-protein kinase CSK-like [Anneissia japonica]
MANTQEIWLPGTECVAKYEFRNSTADDLAFGKGEIITIVASTKDPNWYKAKNSNGRVGMIPANFVKKRESVKLHMMPWFHGKISREGAEELLKELTEGLFLVRESVNFKGDYALCVCAGGKVEHYRIIYTDNKLTIDEDEHFDNLYQLVEHYERDADGLCSRLIKPLPKEGKQDFSVDKESFVKSGWSIDKRNINMGSTIGHGNFGDVLEGHYQGRKVAIKQLKDNTSAAQTFLKEASIMTTLRHKNLVSFLGLVIGDPLYIVLEYMSKGNLVDYLRSRGRSVITKPIQLNFASDIASGMAYLEEKNLAHRDLAARNILISEEDVAKVSDFGLARDVNLNTEVGKIPIKWTAPEALRKNNFSVKSDVWSYGILLWELYSYGRVPYPRVPLAEVLTHVEKGYRMEAPEGCPEFIYRIMRETWELNPQKRPSFKTILKIIASCKGSL